MCYMVVPRRAGEAMIRNSYIVSHPDPWDIPPQWVLHLFQDRAPNGLPRFFKPDVWHNVQLGVGKDFAASAMALLVQLCDGSNIDLRFGHLTQLYKTFCKEFKKTKFVSRLDKNMVGGGGKNDEPAGSWNKAALTVTLLEFLEWFCTRFAEKCNDDTRLKYIMAATKSHNNFMRGLHMCDAWIHAEKARKISEAGSHFVAAYVYLAHLSAAMGEPKFPLKPKLHMVQTACVRLLWESEHAPFAYNCLNESCSIDEDFVGRLAFISRHVSPRLIAIRSLERYLTQVHLAWSG